MPEPANPDKPVSVISVVKNAIGKDLFALPLPVELHEPLTDLQKMSENCEYTELLDQVRPARLNLTKPKVRHAFIADC